MVAIDESALMHYLLCARPSLSPPLAEFSLIKTARVAPFPHNPRSAPAVSASGLCIRDDWQAELKPFSRWPLRGSMKATFCQRTVILGSASTQKRKMPLISRLTPPRTPSSATVSVRKATRWRSSFPTKPFTATTNTTTLEGLGSETTGTVKPVNRGPQILDQPASNAAPCLGNFSI